MAQRRTWTRDELVVALNLYFLYFKLPYGQLHSRNPEIIRLADLIDRTPSAVAMRLSNYAAVAPYHINRGIKGLENAKKQVLPIWEAFTRDHEALHFESEQILARLEGQDVEVKFSVLLQDAGAVEGRERTALTRVRVNQHVFRQMVLANYGGECAVTGINFPQLLAASHIAPWAANASERMNPANGLCLSPLYDKAFDAGLITFNAQ